jgi:hypothetical protein
LGKRARKGGQEKEDRKKRTGKRGQEKKNR